MKKIFCFIFLVLYLSSFASANTISNIKNIEEIINESNNKIILFLDNIPEYELGRASQNVNIYLKNSLVPTDSFQTKSFTIGQSNENDVIIQFNLQFHKPVNIYAEKNPLRLIIESQKYFTEKTYQWLSKGIEWVNTVKSNKNGSLNINQLDIAKGSNVKMEVISVNNNNTGRKKLSEMVKDYNILSAINGGYFGPNGEAIGYLVVKGKKYGFPFRNRAIVGFKGNNCYMSRVPFTGKVRIKGKKTLTINGINRKRNQGEIIIYDSSFGKTTNTPTDKPGAEFVVMDNKITEVYNGNAIIPSLGFVLSIDGKSGEELAEKIAVKEDIVDIIPNFPTQLKNIDFAVTGGPLLVKDKNIVLDLKKEGFNSSYSGSAPRTAIGITKEKIVFLAIDGRQSISKGFSLKELADYLYGIGCSDALNLDGGGSTTMIIKGRIVNYPSDGTERTINNGIILVPDKK